MRFRGHARRNVRRQPLYRSGDSRRVRSRSSPIRRTRSPREGVAWAVVPHGRRALARLSANFYKRPAERIAVTGITGTNGKSTTAFLIESILTAAGRKSALIGTIEYHVAGKVYPAPHTTPEALELARFSMRRWARARPKQSWKFLRTRWRRSACSACRLTSPCSPT